ncbi:type IV secretory system conjugative DNA transfer family protein [Streptomyces sp. NPDC088337]|uniref:type IV secretory system conjugative DNA transfer family protein n=1 Tax=unclassified Streptomyces TaxID=2593676 RepID=UPI002DDA94C4|nr:type IV secretory system conjugative DNA transfer family protein [Streptomyces sp. NBC_01788]WSB27515.1 type IV secretory system conjugative DNA transfer family protein [Streptomyces sp. NBC_01788]
MRPDDRDHGQGRQGRRDGQGGVPDGLLVGVMAFLLGMTLLVWTATGLAGLFTHGSWPAGVAFTRTPPAMRHLITDPHDIPAAWPDTPPDALSGYGLFWGLFIGQLMVLLVLTVFVMGTVARWRAGRLRRRAERAAARERATAPEPQEAPAPVPHEVPTQRAAPQPGRPLVAAQQSAEAPQEAAPAAPQSSNRAEPAAPPTQPLMPLAAGRHGGPAGGRETILTAPREVRQAAAAQAIRDAAGPALVITSNPVLWQDTKDSRAKLGPVLLYDPGHLCDTPARLHWSPTAGCEDKATAAARAAALLAPVRPAAKVDQATGDTAETLLRSFLHAAAVDGRAIRHVHRWAQGTQVQEAVRILRTNPKAAAGSAGELESSLTSYPERRDMAQELTGRALASLVTVNIREACTPNRTDAVALDSFVNEGGTLYVVGESLEDPRTDPGAMPLLTALASSVVERGRRMAERSSSGRLDPPLTLILDDVAAVAPLPQLPELLAAGAGQGLPTLVLLRSREQARARWPHAELPA